MSKPLRLILALAVIPVIAVCAAIASLSIILERALPARAAQMPIVDANAYARQGVQGLSSINGNGQQDLAFVSGRRTFNAEPTNSTAISLMAFGKQLEGDQQTARNLYEDALLVAKRDRLANLWLIEDASQDGRIGFILDRYDVLLRTGGAASDLLFLVLGTALQEEAILPHLEQRLVRNPPWSEQFWLKVTPNPQAIANIGRLRLRLLQKGIENPAGNDGDILRRLASNGHFEIGFRLFNKLAGNKSNSRRTIYNHEFSEPARFAPFDWETFSASGYGAEVDPAAGALVVYSSDAAEALLARQLVAAPAGPSTLRYRVADKAALRAIRTSLRARCASASGQELLSVPIDAASRQSVLSVAGTGCRYLWIEVWANRDPANSAPPEYDVLIDSIDVQPAA